MRKLIQSAAIIAAITIGGAPAQAALLAEYLFDGNGNDSSGNGHHLTLAGNAGFSAGQSGQALTLDGVGDFAFTPFANYTLSAFTLEAWIKVPSYDRNVHYISLYQNNFVVLGVMARPMAL